MSSFFQSNNFSFVPPDNDVRLNKTVDNRGGNQNPLGISQPAIPLMDPNLRIPGPAFGRIPGDKGLSPFCGTIYDTKLSGNHLEGIHIEPVLAIDSASRNHTKYPCPNYYDIQLNTTYKDVVKLELKFALIPNSGYVINRANNCFYFQDRSEQLQRCIYYQVELPCGDWPAENNEGPSICSILEEEMNQASRSFGHRKDCNVMSSVPFCASACNCSTSMAPRPGSLCYPPNPGPTKQTHELKQSTITKVSKNSISPGWNLKKKKEIPVNNDMISESTDCCSSSESQSGDDPCWEGPSKYSVTFCRYTRKFTIRQVSGSGLFKIIFCGGLDKVGEQGTVTQPIMGVDRFLSPEVPLREFEKRYIDRSLGPVLGFGPENCQGCLVYTSDGVINFDRDRYIILRMPGFERIQSNSGPLQGAFCIIAATKIANDFIFAKWDNDPYNSETYTKYFNPPLPNLSKIRIEFYNSDGEPFDFNGIDHLLVFDVGSLTQQTTFPVIPVGLDVC